jgi:predicted NBD/HSP70 family sugar kinase
MPALLRSAQQVSGCILTPAQIFAEAADGDVDLQEIVEQYTLMLGQGIVNIVNMFRPQMIILGGLLSDITGQLIEPLMKQISEDAFGGIHGKLPELRTAVLGGDAGIIGAANL